MECFNFKKITNNDMNDQNNEINSTDINNNLFYFNNFSKQKFSKLVRFNWLFFKVLDEFVCMYVMYCYVPSDSWNSIAVNS